MQGVASRVSSPQFIGRDVELAALTEAVARAGAGDASITLVGGEAGIGKTRLITEVGERARDGGAIVLEGGCVTMGDGGGLPFAPFVEALRRLPAVLASGRFGDLDLERLRTPATAELGRLMPEFGTPASPDVGEFARPEWVQARIFEGLLALLRDLGERAPIVCILEDLHWADGSTRDLVGFLARNIRTERLAIIGTYRTDEIHRRHPLRPWLSEMERLPRVRRLELTRFGRAELGAQVEAIVGHAPEADLLETIERRAEGNPFFIEELLAAGGGTDAGATRLPETLREVLLSRVASLSDEAQRVLGMAAVAGRSVEPELLATVAAVPESDLEGPLREALAAQLLVEDPAGDGVYRFRHALLAEAVYDDLLPSERRRLHAAYASALDARQVPDGAAGASLLAALAHHASEAHESVRALRAWIAAARAATESYAFAESVRAFERAIDLWDAVPPDDRPTDVDPSHLHHEASLAAMVASRPDRAVELSRAALRSLDQLREPERWAAASERLARAAWVSGAPEESIRIIEATAAAIKGARPSPEGARVQATLASTYMLRGDHARAIPAAETAIALARASDAPVAEAHAMSTLGTSTALLGRCEDGIAISREALARNQGGGEAYDVGRAYANFGSVLLTCGHLEEAFEVARSGEAWSRSVGAHAQYGHFLLGNALDAAVDLGRWDDAEGMVNELLAAELVGVNRMGIVAVAGAFLVRRGRFDDANRLLDEGRVLVQPIQDAQFTGPTHVGLVERALTDGDAAGAAATASDGLARLAQTDDHFYALELAAMSARAHADLALQARARRDEGTAASAVAGARDAMAYLEGVRDEQPGTDLYGGRAASMLALATAESRRASGAADPEAWLAAVQATDRSRVAWPMAYTRFRLAEALLEARTPRRDAETALADAHQAAERLGATPLRDWIEGLARRARVRIPGPATIASEAATGDDGIASRGAASIPAESPPVAALGDLRLTRREREVLPLVAAGHTNKRIAEILFISENTAGVHVSNILGKLGVTTRTEAAAVAARLGLDRVGS
jgi:DNA-binding CsgD family transcriptional regulator/tetratricopeptide (TPR) repeat protein